MSTCGPGAPLMRQNPSVHQYQYSGDGAVANRRGSKTSRQHKLIAGDEYPRRRGAEHCAAVDIVYGNQRRLPLG
jgi:hypothetical protein